MLAKYMLRLHTARKAAAHSSHQAAYDSCNTDTVNGRPVRQQQDQDSSKCSNIAAGHKLAMTGSPLSMHTCSV